MIIMDIKLDNFYAFRNFHMNMSYPKKIVHSYIENEFLPERPHFRYKKAIILMGPNASGKTSLGRILLRIFNQVQSRELSGLRSMVADKSRTSTFSIDFLINSPVLYRMSATFKPIEGNADTNSGIFFQVKKTDVKKNDSYEACSERLSRIKNSESEEYTEELKKIPRLGWAFGLSENTDSQPNISFDTPKRLHIFETVMKVLDPAIVSINALPQVKDSYIINFENRQVIIQDGEVVNRNLLSSGTYDGIGAASILARIICKDNGFYYCDEKFSRIQSDVEKAMLAVMISSLTEYDQLFFTTHNTEILSMAYPKHTFMFLKKDMNNKEQPISVISASDYLKRNTDSLRSAVENDLFSMTPNIEAIYSLEESKEVQQA